MGGTGAVPARPADLVRRWVEAFNPADQGALAAVCTEDATIHQVVEALLVGRDARRARFGAGFTRSGVVLVAVAVLAFKGGVAC